jgi:cytochrome c oxidase subunit II
MTRPNQGRTTRNNPMSQADQPRRRFRRVALAAAAVGAAFLAGCAEDSPQDTWTPEGPPARQIDNLQRPVFAIAGVVGLIVFIAIGWCIFRYRDRGQAIPKQTHGNTKLEVALTIVPFVILVGVAVPTASTILDLADTSGCDLTVNVTGQQWWWEYDYPATRENQVYGITEPIVTSGEIVIPEETCVLLRVTSRDVIHSYWIPRLNGKKDAVPGRVHELKLEADDPGYYSGQCTEFCGLSHANMRMRAISLTQADFATWVANQQSDAVAYAETDQSPEAVGYRAFRQNCARCHQVNGMLNDDGSPTIAAPEAAVVSGVAPNLTHLMTRSTFAGATWGLLDEECMDTLTSADAATVGGIYLEGVSADCLNRLELEEWLRNSPAKKPMYTDNPDEDGRVRGMPNLGLSEETIDSIVTYLKTLK